MQIQAIKILNGNNGSYKIQVGYPMACPDGEDRGVLRIDRVVNGTYTVTCEDKVSINIEAQNLMVQYYPA